MTDIKTSGTQIKSSKTSHILLLSRNILCQVARYHKIKLPIVTVNCLIVKTDCINHMLKFNEKFSNSETQQSKI